VFHITYIPGWETWAWGIAGGLLCGVAGGWAGALVVVRSAPILVLRESA
jgi:predicted lysophospholipase L1 biosynthesis ABC-type transport system permease subunit